MSDFLLFGSHLLRKESILSIKIYNSTIGIQLFHGDETEFYEETYSSVSEAQAAFDVLKNEFAG